MARRREFVRGAGAIHVRRQTIWFQFVPVSFTMTAAGGTLISTLNAAALALRPFTIIRSRFMTMVRSDQGAANEDQVGAIGMAVVSDQAVAIGVTAIPTPVTNMASDLWFLYDQYMCNATNLANLTNPACTITTDSKAMRKVDVGQDVVCVAELNSIGQGTTLFTGGRMLIKTH